MHHRPCHKRSAIPASVLEERARGLRYAPTFTELALWSQIRGRRLGVLFRRQVPVGGRYIADFFAPELGLVVEVDGEYHDRRNGPDARRDRALLRLGYHVLRLNALTIVRELPAALATIREMIARLRP